MQENKELAKTVCAFPFFKTNHKKSAKTKYCREYIKSYRSVRFY